MINLFEKLLNLIYTRKCYFCRSTKEDSLLCSQCRKKIVFLPPSPIFKVDDTPVYACTIYEDVIKKLIINFKYYNKKAFAAYMADIMFSFWKELNIFKQFTIIPVPIHKNRKKERKYNHMDLAADEFSKLTGFQVNKNFLIRVKDTHKQFNLNKNERTANLKNAFNLNLNALPDKNTNLLIIDDITASGATLNEIISILKKNGYNNITTLAFSIPDIWNNQTK